MEPSSIARDLEAPPLAAAGSATGLDAAPAAVDAACSGIAGAPAIVFAFPSRIPPSAIDAGALSARASAPVVGMSGNGSIGADGAIEAGCSALAIADSIAARVKVSDEGSSDLRASTRAAAADAIGGITKRYKLLLLFLDTRTGDQAESVAGAYEAVGPEVPLAGGASGGSAPFQIGAEAVLTKSVVAVGLGSDAPIGVSQVHGCRPIGTPAIVTRSDGRVVHELNGRPATEVFLEETGFGGIEMDTDDFEALAVTHPLAQPELNQSERVRHILGCEGTSLVCATRIPENAAVIFTRETPDEVVATAGQGVSEAVAALGQAPARAALIFDCAGRKRAAADSLSHEVAGLLSAFPARPPLAGLFTHGEIARIRGAKGDRNHALVVVALA